MYVSAFARFMSWPPSALHACRMGELDGIWRDLLYDQYDRLTMED